jgi:hypothetical protein
MTQTDNPLLAELRWVHGMLRRDLGTIRELAAAAAGGAPAADLRDGLARLQARGPLFQLRVNCLRYCALVHAHHHGEGIMLFPAVRRAAPELGPVVDRLEADHRVVSDLLDEVSATAHELAGDDDPALRARLVDALRALSDTLLEHLDLEETSLGPVLQQWRHWPFA